MSNYLQTNLNRATFANWGHNKLNHTADYFFFVFAHNPCFPPVSPGSRVHVNEIGHSRLMEEEEEAGKLRLEDRGKGES